jgi:membrane protein DedA with SNARE-associated domain
LTPAVNPLLSTTGWSDWNSWPDAARAAVLGVSTLVQEDAPLFAAAGFAGAGRLTWTAAFLGCFLGIWMGDALLYVLARSLGRPALANAWVRRWVNPAAVARSEAWFQRRGAWLLVASRFIPGMRLPTYLASGLIRYPLPRFLGITGAAVAIWTASVLLAVGVLATHLPSRYAGLANPWVVAVAGALAIYALRRLASAIPVRARQKGVAVISRWMRWEFWPAWLFYIPVVLNSIRLAVRYRGMTLPTIANPCIPGGGMIGESKSALLQTLHSIAPDACPAVYTVPAGRIDERTALINRLVAENKLAFPFVLKPDLGERGKGVKIIRNPADLDGCVSASEVALVAQPYFPGPFEAGVFYYRFPGAERGRIFAVTDKRFPEVVGDGRRTLEELIWTDPRARLMAAKYLARLGPRASTIPGAGEPVRLVEAGNHAQGAVFLDGGRLITPALEAAVDAISAKIPGFFIGRYDLRYGSEPDFGAGRGFKIVELNGAAAEATSIYDPSTSLWKAYRTLFRQWDLVFAIGAANRDAGARPMGLFEFLRTVQRTKSALATQPVSD